MMIKSDEKIMGFVRNAIPYIILLLTVVLIRTFLITPIRVEGSSMYNTLKDGEVLLLKKYDKSYHRFDVIVFNYNNDRLIKRIIGVPGDHIKYKNNKLYVNDVYVKESFLKNNQKTYDFDLKDLGYDEIPKGFYFVLGDNRTNSTDSRFIGLVSEEEISGKTDLILFPFTRFGKFTD